MSIRIVLKYNPYNGYSLHINHPIKLTADISTTNYLFGRNSNVAEHETFLTERKNCPYLTTTDQTSRWDEF